MIKNENARVLEEALGQVWNEGDEKAISKFYHPDFQAHYGGGLEIAYAELVEDL